MSCTIQTIEVAGWGAALASLGIQPEEDGMGDASFSFYTEGDTLRDFSRVVLPPRCISLLKTTPAALQHIRVWYQAIGDDDSGARVFSFSYSHLARVYPSLREGDGFRNWIETLPFCELITSYPKENHDT